MNMMNAMKKKLFLITIIGLCTTPIVTHGAIKCWTNNEGVRECGNTIPPEYSQKSSKTLNERGITVETRKRALTKEELAEKQQREEEEKRRIAEEKAARKKQNAADRVLLYTFLTEEEIIAARDRKLTVIDGNIEVTNITIGKLKGDLKEQRKKAANSERKGKPVSEGTLTGIASLERQIKSKKEFIEAKKAEKKAIIEQYAKDLERFRELKEQGRKLR